MSRTIAVLSLILLLSCGSGPNQEQLRQRVHENNRGVGLMGSFEYSKAAAVFAQLVQQFPDWPEAKINLAIATLNTQEPGCEDRALALLDQVLQQQPNQVQALYCSGLLQLYKGEEARAAESFERALKLVPDDAYILYYIGQCRAQIGDTEPALQAFLAASAKDPYLRSAYYGAFQAYQRLGKPNEAREQITRFNDLKNSPRARQVEFKYTRMGSLAEVRAYSEPGITPAVPPSGALFQTPTALALPPGKQWRSASSLTCADLNGDGRYDLFASGAWSSDGLRLNAVYLESDTGLVPAPDHPLAQISDVNAALWGDIDNDGHLDVYLCREGASQIWTQHGEAWAPAAPIDSKHGTRDGRLIDADHDGDLDLFVIYKDGQCQLWNNNLDGSWKPLAQEIGLKPGNARQALFADLDNDRDLDLILINEQAPHQVLLNDLLWNYHEAPNSDAFRSSQIDSLLAIDRHGDGQCQLVSHQSSRTLTLWHPGKPGWPQENLGSSVYGELDWLDLDGSGNFRLFVRDQNGYSLRDPETGKSLAIALPQDLGTFTTLVRDPAKGPALIAAAKDGQLSLCEPGPGRWPFAALSFSGASSEDGTTRSNRSAIGTRFAVRNGNRWAASQWGPIGTRPGQSLAPLAIGLGGEPALDFVALTWPDGVFQTELGLAPAKHHVIAEVQRQLASCPVLFAWDGKGYRFISDLLGVGGIGFNLARGEYGVPRPWERFQMADNLIVPVGDSVRLKIAEPMEEASYLDQVQLSAYDLPEGWQMVLDERMATAAPDPSGASIYYKEEQLPQKVTGWQGQDMTAALAEADLKAATTPPIDHRFLGLLKSEHQLVLEFAQNLDTSKGEPYLVIDGWLEYPYSQTCFAAWQAGIAYEPLSLDIPNGKGWRTILPQFGYPAGMPRRMSVALPQSVNGTKQLRLRTNQEIYLDRISIIYRRPDSECAVKITPLSLKQSNLAAEGFAKRTTGPQALPHFDDLNRQPLWDTRHQAGYYTNFGAITELLSEEDNALAIFGPGEAITLEFAQAPTKAPNTTRTWVLEVKGWCKDMDLYTKTGDTLEPIPKSKDPSPQATKLQAQHNTRYQAGY